MEEPNEVHSEDNKVSSEKNKKRQLKTPAQVTALEEFYNANKYPSEELKSQLAEQIGLTEKQVSGWFCHRRLKDKRLARDEGHRSSGAVQDRKQDSCGSTKQGDLRHVDPREVESPRLNGQHYAGNFSRDDTSSESSSSLREGLNSRRVDPYDLGTPYQRGVGKNPGYKPAGYLKVKGNIENVAITAVKRQLGRNYREDGPPLGVSFQQLPPGAFEMPIGEPIREPCDARDQALLCSPDTYAARKQPRFGTRYGAPNSHISSKELHMEGTHISQRRVKQKYSLDEYDDPVGQAPVYNIKMKDKISSKLGVERMRSNHPPPRPYGAKAASERTEAWLHESGYVSPRVTEWNEYMKSPPPNIEKKAGKEFRDPVRGKMHPTNEFAVPKRSSGESELDFAPKASLPELSPHKPDWTKGSALEMPSSFSEDETAETSSSLNQ